MTSNFLAIFFRKKSGKFEVDKERSVTEQRFPLVLTLIETPETNNIISTNNDENTYGFKATIKSYPKTPYSDVIYTVSIQQNKLIFLHN